MSGRRSVGLVLGLGLAASCGVAADRTRPPNVVLIVADDLGFGDVGYHGGYAETPHIDRLAREGVALERFYAYPMCSPTRAGLLTGRYPIRFGMARAPVAPWREHGLDPAERTLPEVLAEAGYTHRALFGKWHLGHLARRWHPLEQGFTHFRGHYNGAIDYFEHTRSGERDWHLDREPHMEEGYATDLIADAACRFIAERADEGPFLCTVSFNAPHAPLQVPDAWAARYAAYAAPDGSASLKQVMAAMIACMDDGIGRILDALDEAGVADNTIVWFVSDNGGIQDLPENNRPLRGDKGTLFEGGVRVPACVRWPARLPAGHSLGDPTAFVDLLPTLMRAAGIEEPGPRALDGVDLLDALADGTPVPARDLFFYTGFDGPRAEQVALRTPRWKLLVAGPDLSATPVGAEHRVLLFDLASDPSETRDVAADHPDVVAELTPRLVEFRRLQPPDAIAPYGEGSEAFEVPRDWRIPDS